MKAFESKVVADPDSVFNLQRCISATYVTLHHSKVPKSVCLGFFSSRTGFGFENLYNEVVDTQTKAPYWPIRTGYAKANRFFR